ncbi:MAG: PAS domain S-box protein [Phycisphaerae bacterium]
MNWALWTLLFANLAVLAALLWLLRVMRTALRSEPDATGEAGLRLSRLEAVLSSLPDPLLVVDAEMNVFEEFAPSFGPLTRGLLREMPEAHAAEVRRRVHAAITERHAEHYRFSVGERSYEVAAAPLSSGPLAPGAALLAIREVTSQVNSDEALRRLASRNHAVLRSAMDGFFVVGEDQRFIEVNDAYCRMTGYSAAELLERKLSDLEVTDLPGARLAAQARTGLNHFITAHRHKDGPIVHLENSITVLRDQGRKILVGFVRDVTARRRAEETLRESEQRYRALFEESHDAILIASPDGMVIDVNPALLRLTGCGRAEVIAKHLHDRFVDVADRERVTNALVKAQGLRDIPIRVRRRDGGVVACELSIAMRHGPAGQTLGVQAILRDVSEQQRADDERRRLEHQFHISQKRESLGMLAGGVAHDFNNFLVGVLCNVSLAMEKIRQDREVRPHLQKVLNASRRASELARLMLAYSGQPSVDAKPLDLTTLVNDMADFLRAALPKTVSLTLQLTDGLPRVRADAGQLQQVIMNLIINGAEAIGAQPGTVRLTTSRLDLTEQAAKTEFADQKLVPGHYVVLQVADSGCGMSPETLSRIFDPFFTTKFTGRGLGLAALLGIVRGHDGAVRVESRVNEGTTFTVLLPAIAVAPAPSPARDAPAPIPAGSTVLVIDDEADIREVVEAILGRHGVNVLAAAGGRDGIDLFRAHQGEIDLVLLDLTMPIMSGEQVLHELLSIDPQARVVLSTGYSEREAGQRFASERLAGFMQKPYTAEMLVDKLARAMNGTAPRERGEARSTPEAASATAD